MSQQEEQNETAPQQDDEQRPTQEGSPTTQEQEPALAADAEPTAGPTEEAAVSSPEEEVEEASAEEQEVSGDEDEEAQEGEASEEGGRGRQRRRRGSNHRGHHGVPDVGAELTRLFELSTKYPELGAPLAKLAIKLGYPGMGERLILMQLEEGEEARGVEFHRVAADLARKEGKREEVLQHVLDGLTVIGTQGEESSRDDRGRLLHLVRLGFATLLFDFESLQAAPEFTEALSSKLPELVALYEEDPFYHTLRAQALWFSEKEQSEQAWEQAVALRDAETTWNSRGTWYKEADKDLSRAEWAYRSGLKALPTSTLLRHNLAQVLMDRAQGEGAELPQIRSWLGESEALLRQAQRHARRHTMRRHINSNIERVRALQADLPREEESVEGPPQVGDVVRGRVRSFKNYGAFLSLGKHYSGLLHISEMAHELVHDPAQVLKIGDMIEVKVIEVSEREEGEGVRIGLSRKAILPAPHPGEAGGEASAEGGSPSEESRQQDGDRRGRGRGRRRGQGRGGRQGEGQGGEESRPQQTGGNHRGGGGGGGNRRNQRGGGGGGGRGQRDGNNDQRGHQDNKGGSSSGMGSLGEMLLAKLEEKKGS